MHEHVEVIRLESQLTVPTRNRTHLSDVWVAIASRTRLTAWADVLQSVADSHHPRRAGAGKIQLVRMSDQRGWIVERGVDLRLCSPSDVEATVRELVTLANRAVGSSVAISPFVQAEKRWTARVRLALMASRNAALTVVDVPGRRSEVDASSAV